MRNERARNGKKEEKQIIHQRRIELKGGGLGVGGWVLGVWRGGRRREWLKKEKEIIRQHRRETKETK